jgi:hypothetical protein
MSTLVQPPSTEALRWREEVRQLREMFAALKQLLAATQNRDAEDKSVRWFISSDANLPADQQRPEWLRTAAFDQATNTVYLPAGMSGHEDRTFLVACRAGVPYVADQGHTYVPAGWLRKQHPNLHDDSETLEQRIRAAASGAQ